MMGPTWSILHQRSPNTQENTPTYRSGVHERQVIIKYFKHLISPEAKQLVSKTDSSPILPWGNTPLPPAIQSLMLGFALLSANSSSLGASPGSVHLSPPHCTTRIDLHMAGKRKHTLKPESG